MGCDLPRCERIPEIAIRYTNWEHNRAPRHGTATGTQRRQDKITKLSKYLAFYTFIMLFGFSFKIYFSQF